MAVWCFVCDAPVVASGDGAVCARCGRTGTVVEDVIEKRSQTPPLAPLLKVPKWVWITLAAVLVIVLFTLMQSGFHLE